MTATDSATSENVREAVPFLGVADMAASLKFYVDGLGFRVSIKWEPKGRLKWCWLRLGGASLMLQEFWRAGDDEPVNRPSGTLGQGVTICFMCKDALAIHRQAAAASLNVQEPVVGNRLWVTSLTDPDGYRIDFESPTDVPEETTLSQWQASGAKG